LDIAVIDDEEAAALRKKLQELKTELKTITERMTIMLDQMDNDEVSRVREEDTND